MANHVAFTLSTNIPVYFCDPHSPSQRGTNENTNGLLRQLCPRARISRCLRKMTFEGSRTRSTEGHG